MRPMLPYAMQVSMALLSGNRSLADKLMADAVYDIAKSLIEITKEYESMDLPFIVASMRIVANAMAGVLNDSGNNIAENIVKNTTCIAIDVEGFRKEMDKDRGDDSTKE